MSSAEPPRRVRWSGPSLNLDSPKVATETVEIAHHGFRKILIVNGHGGNQGPLTAVF